MKRNSIIKGIVLSAIASTMITGCGSATTKINDSIDKVKKDVEQNIGDATSLSISGKAVDGYLQYATVCLDLNADGYCQNTEPITTTTADGTFNLDITSAIQSQDNYNYAMLLVYGGKDVDTGKDFVGKLLAPPSGTVANITPVTTLLAHAVKEELKSNQSLSTEQVQAKVAAAKTKVARALDINEADMGKDPVAEQKNGNDRLIRRALQLQKAVEAMIVTADDKNEKAQEIYEALIAGLNDMGNEKGVEKLFEKTIQRAQNNPQTKALMGGDDALRLGDAAQRIAGSIDDSFDGFGEEAKSNDDFLGKVAAITNSHLNKVEIAYEEGNIDEIAGQITVDTQFFQPNFNWNHELIRGDLRVVGILNPSAELIGSIVALYGNVRPGILFDATKRLKESNNEQLLAVYEKIVKFKEAIKLRKETQEAKKQDNTIAITAPMSIFVPAHKGYEKVTFNANNTLSFERFGITENGTFEQDDEEDHDDIVFSNGQWTTMSKTAQPYIKSNANTVNLSSWNETAELVKGRAIGGVSTFIPEFPMPVAMPTDAQMNFIKITKTADTYSLHERVKNYSEQNNATFASISDFISNQCGNGWILGDHNGGITFKGVKTGNNDYDCNVNANKGELVFVNNGNENIEDVSTNRTAGTWEIKDLGQNINVLVVKPYNLKRFNHDDKAEYPIFALKDGVLHRGDLELTGTVRTFPVYNESAMNAIKSTVTDNWDAIKYDMEDDYNEDEDYNNNQNVAPQQQGGEQPQQQGGEQPQQQDQIVYDNAGDPLVGMFYYFTADQAEGIAFQNSSFQLHFADGTVEGTWTRDNDVVILYPLDSDSPISVNIGQNPIVGQELTISEGENSATVTIESIGM